MKNVIIHAQEIEPATRHAHIFQEFDSLAAGESLTIVNSHDPFPLLNQFTQNRENQFTSEYLENGPTTWKVKLTKKMKEGCCGCC